ncbi:LOW QUALITY PROTEIN: hypothetical protein M9H77_21489 [Catharanthus roseus]|uniref:Uncharacterized protein n=1 Tax=Catharanthus roseus TaxID=4058 RepID=A0ACC0ANH3_CATRO|nr:LOW QUALITY PROTEIN: hypothetical protein M9H77_21489 [Catharanthus roseus]
MIRECRNTKKVTHGSRSSDLEEGNPLGNKANESRFEVLGNLEEHEATDTSAQVVVNKIQAIAGPENYTTYSGPAHIQKDSNGAQKNIKGKQQFTSKPPALFGPNGISPSKTSGPKPTIIEAYTNRREGPKTRKPPAGAVGKETITGPKHNTNRTKNSAQSKGPSGTRMEQNQLIQQMDKPPHILVIEEQIVPKLVESSTGGKLIITDAEILDRNEEEEDTRYVEGEKDSLMEETS